MNKNNLVEETAGQSLEKSRKGGRAGRKKNTLKECMISLLDLPVSDTKYREKLAEMGIDIAKMDNRALLTVTLFMEATERGSIQAFKEIRNIIGEDKSLKVDKTDASKLASTQSGIIILPDIKVGDGHG